MRPSPYRHPLAVLRSFLKLDQQQMATLAECSRGTIQAVELTRMKLSDEMALRISKATGASVDWLLAGDPDAPMLDSGGKPYTLEAFSSVQYHAANDHRLWNEWTGEELENNLQFYVSTAWSRSAYALLDLFKKAAIAGRDDLAEIKVEKAIEALYRDLGLAAPQDSTIDLAEFRRWAENATQPNPSFKPSPHSIPRAAVIRSQLKQPTPKLQQKEEAPKMPKRPSASQPPGNAKKPSPGSSPSAEPKPRRPRTSRASKNRKNA